MYVTVRHAGEQAIEPVKKPAQQASAGFLRPQQKRGQRRAQTERVKRRQEHGDGDGDRELLVQPSRNAWYEGGRHKHGREHQGDSNYRRGDFFHGFERGGFGSQTILYMALDRFHYHDGVVHHQANRQHQAKKRKRVDGETKQRKDSEGAHQRDGHGQQGNQGRAPALEKQIDHQDHQRNRDQQGYNNLLHSLNNRPGGIEGNSVVNVRGETVLHLRHQFLDGCSRIDGVRSWQLINRDNSAGLPIEASGYAVVLRSQLHARDIFESHYPALGRLADHDLSKFFRRSQPALCPNSVSKLLSRGHRFAPNASGRIHRILRLDCVHDVGNGDGELGQLVRLDPQPHRVLTRSENLHLADSVGTRDGINQVDEGIVGQESSVVGAVGRVKGQQHQRSGYGLPDGDSEVGNFDGKLRRRLSLP